MNSRERFYATIERREVDRPARWLGQPTKEAIPQLLSGFRVPTLNALIEKLDDDIYPVEVPYHQEPANHIACAFNFAAQGTYNERTLTGAGYFASKTSLDCVRQFPWPDPAEHMNVKECYDAIHQVPDDKAALGILWSAHFQDAGAAFGLENALMQMLLEPELYRAVIERITEFYLKANRIFYEAGKGRLDAVLLGNDLGTQNGLLLSPELVRSFVMPGIRRLVGQAKEYGYKVVYHSCGAIRPVIPDLIAAGVDVVHPIQARAAGMEPEELKKLFGHKVAFCGGIDTQELLVHGPVGAIQEKVRELTRLFPTGLILSPSHEAIQSDVPFEHVAAMYNL